MADQHEHRKLNQVIKDSLKAGSTSFKARITTSKMATSVGRKVTNLLVSPFSAMHGIFDSILPVANEAPIVYPVVIPPPMFVEPVVQHADAVSSLTPPNAISVAPFVQVATQAGYTARRFTDSHKNETPGGFEKIDVDKLLDEWVKVDSVSKVVTISV